MNSTLRIILVVFCLVWVLLLFYLIRKNKLPIKYSVIWFIPMCSLLLLVLFPNFVSYCVSLLGMVSSTNFVVGIILTILLIITLLLTLIIANLKRKITLLIQEVSILKEKK